MRCAVSKYADRAESISSTVHSFLVRGPTKRVSARDGVWESPTLTRLRTPVYCALTPLTLQSRDRNAAIGS
jgi:hypothetical protein